MSKKILLGMLLIACATLFTYDVYVLATPSKQAKPVKVGLNPIVRLVKDDRTYCTGVVIDPTTILTASHCVTTFNPFIGTSVTQDDIDIRAFDNVDRHTAARVKGVLTQLDRAILKGDFHIFAPARYISDVETNISHRLEGKKYVSCGYPLGGQLFCTQTTFIGPYGFMMAVKGVLIPGMSGGPTMLQDGTVIALNIAVENDFSLVSPVYNVDDEKGN